VPPRAPAAPVALALRVRREPVYVAGRYLKLERCAGRYLRLQQCAGAVGRPYSGDKKGRGRGRAGLRRREWVSQRGGSL